MQVMTKHSLDDFVTEEEKNLEKKGYVE